MTHEMIGATGQLTKSPKSGMAGTDISHTSNGLVGK